MGKQSRSKQLRRERRKDVEKFGAQRRADEARAQRILAPLGPRRDPRGPVLDRPEHFRSEGFPVSRALLDQFGYRHGESFALMLYATEDGSTWEWIWNSRDGVTPFCVNSRSGRLMNHVHWDRDQFVPDYKPNPGERIFVDLTPERAREYATKTVERAWDHPEHPARERYATKEEAVARIAQDMLQPGAPDIIEVKG